MRLFKFIPVFALLSVFLQLFANDLDFSKRSGYSFREGEYGVMTLNLKNSETYDYKSEIRKPFVLRKVGSAGDIELIYDIRTMDPSELEEGKTYRVSFPFTKINIGKRENLTVSAVYRPELRLVVDDSLRVDFMRLNFTPGEKSRTIILEALRPTSGIRLDDPDGLLSLGDKETLSLEKGLNEVEIFLKHEENRRGEAVLNRRVREGNISELFLLVTASGFKSVMEVVSNDIEETEFDYFENEEVSSEIDLLYGDIESHDPSSAGSGGGFGFAAILIISVMAVIIIVLVLMVFSGRKSDACQKFESFFDDVATLVRYNAKGINLDKSIEEIMMILLEKFEFPQENESAPKPGTDKKVLKKPAGLKTAQASPEKPEAKEDGLSIDLNFDSGAKKEEGKDKKISRGFDFLDD